MTYFIVRYADLAKAYRNIQTENQKVKEVMQQTQDKALRLVENKIEQVQPVKPRRVFNDAAWLRDDKLIFG